MGHVLRHFAVFFGNGFDVCGVGAQDEGAADVAQRAPAGGFGTVFIALVFLLRRLTVQFVPFRQEVDGKRIQQGFARLMVAQRVDVFRAVPQFGFRRHAQKQGFEGVVQEVV